MGRKRILKDGKRVRKAHVPKKKKKKKKSQNQSKNTNKTNHPKNKNSKPKKKTKGKKPKVKFDWVTWNRSLITARLKDIKKENKTTKKVGDVILEEITLEL